MSNNKFESLLELLINEENDKAEALFHEIVVEKSRDIYENLADEEVTAEAKEESKEDAKEEVKETEATEEKVEETSEEKVEETKEEEKVEEGIAMKAVKAPAKGSDDNAKSPVAANSGAKGAEAKPQSSSGDEKGKPAPKAGDMGGTTEPNLKKV